MIKISEKHKLRKELGLLDVTALTSGIVIGAGLFIVTGLGAKYAGSYVWLAYLIGAIPVFFAGLSTANLATFYPVEGGESYVYPSRLINRFIGFLSGWGMWFAVIGPIAITAKAFIEYLNELPNINNVPIIGGAIAVILVFFIINYFGLKIFSPVQNILFLFMVAGILIFSIWGLFNLNLNLLGKTPPSGAGGIFKAASMLIFSYAGLTLGADVGEETKNPKKTLPLGIFLGLLVPVILYAFSSLVCVGVIPWDQFAADPAPYVAAAKSFMGPAGTIFIIIVAFAAILSSHNGEQAVATRIGFGLSRDKIISGKWAHINKYGIPDVALITTIVITIVLILTGTLELLVTIIVAMFLFNWLVTHIGVLMAQKKFPEMYAESGFKLDGWKKIIPWLGIITTLYALYLQGTRAIIYAVIWFAVGAVIYYIGMKVGDKEEIIKLTEEWPGDRYMDEIDI